MRVVAVVTEREGVILGTTTQTMLLDIDKFCLFRATGGRRGKKIIGPFVGWRGARICPVAEADAKPMHSGKLTYVSQ